jgi:RimJ/RimL family protein N-acetyltransferase
LTYAFDTIGAKRVMARIAPANASSISVACKLGMCIAPELSNEKSSTYLAFPANAGVT